MKIAVVFRGKLRNEDCTQYKIDKVLNYHRLFFNNHHVDFFAHLWDFETKNILNMVSESNSIYTDEINDLLSITRLNNYDIIFAKTQSDDNNICEIRNRQFAQVSSAISIKNSVKNFNFDGYDLVCLSRLDLPLFLDSWDNNIPQDNEILVNKHNSRITAGDYFFIMSPINYKAFSGLYDFYKKYPEKISPQYHRWMTYYITDVLKLNIKWTNVSVAIIDDNLTGDRVDLWKYLEHLSIEL